MGLKVGEQIKIVCEEPCGHFLNADIYGDGIFSADSSICKAAVYS